MPYKSKGKCVYKKKRDGSRGKKVGCTKGPVKDYLAALYANTDESLETTSTTSEDIATVAANTTENTESTFSPSENIASTRESLDENLSGSL